MHSKIESRQGSSKSFHLTGKILAILKNFAETIVGHFYVVFFFVLFKCKSYITS